jgi:hypothetical protein
MKSCALEGCCDCEQRMLVRVRIEKLDEQPHLVGREALIETHYAKVLFVDEDANP